MEKKLVDEDLDKVSAGLTEEQMNHYRELRSAGKIKEAHDYINKCIDERAKETKIKKRVARAKGSRE